MDQQSAYTSGRSQEQGWLWTHGFSLACVIGLLMLAVCGYDLLVAGQRPLLADGPEKVNPNIAPLGSLIRLDGVGKGRAMDIIHYRQQHSAEGPAFITAADMEDVSGFGFMTIAKLEPYLTFESNRVNH